MGGAMGSSSALQDKSSSADQIGLWMAGLGPERGESLISKVRQGPGLCQPSVGLSPAFSERRGLCVRGPVLIALLYSGLGILVVNSDAAELKLGHVDIKP